MLSSATSAFQLQLQNIFINVFLIVAHFHLDCCCMFIVLRSLGFRMRTFRAFPEFSLSLSFFKQLILIACKVLFELHLLDSGC